MFKKKLLAVMSINLLFTCVQAGELHLKGSTTEKEKIEHYLAIPQVRTFIESAIARGQVDLKFEDVSKVAKIMPHSDIKNDQSWILHIGSNHCVVCENGDIGWSSKGPDFLLGAKYTIAK